MELKGWIYILGFLSICVTFIVLGTTLTHAWYTVVMLIAGIVGVIVWFIGLISLALAMNTDV